MKKLITTFLFLTIVISHGYAQKKVVLTFKTMKALIGLPIDDMIGKELETKQFPLNGYNAITTTYQFPLFYSYSLFQLHLNSYKYETPDSKWELRPTLGDDGKYVYSMITISHHGVNMAYLFYYYNEARFLIVSVVDLNNKIDEK